MYRIVKEENRLSGKIQYIIEKRKKFLWMVSWIRDLDLDVQQIGPVGAPTLSGAKYKLDQIIAWDGKILKKTTGLMMLDPLEKNAAFRLAYEFIISSMEEDEVYENLEFVNKDLPHKTIDKLDYFL